MRYPKIVFSQMTLKENIEYIKWSYSVKNDLMSPYYYTLQYFPELKDISEDASKEEINKIIEKIVFIRYNEKINEINSEVERYNKIWEPYNDKYFEVLCKYLNSSFRENLNTINAHVGLMPINPRNLSNCSFDVDINISDEKIIDVCAHEACHFVWFNKWKELFPDCPEDDYNSGLPWQYSEIVVDPILNSKEINNVLNISCRAYDNFYKMIDNDKFVIDYLRDIYNTNNPIEDKIINGYEYIKNIFINKRKF